MPDSAKATRKSVAIVGGGWAGLACALKLAQAGYQPVVFESAPEPGGRARRALIEGHHRDNGQHLMLSGCKALNTLFNAIGLQLPTLPFTYLSDTQELRVAARGGRWALVVALLRAKGFTWHQRFKLLSALIRLQMNGWQVPKQQTVAEWLSINQQPLGLIEHFWTPLALAILNTPLHEAAMSRFAPVLRDTLAIGGNAVAIIHPTSNLSDSIVSPMLNAIKAAGGTLHCGSRVSRIEKTDSGYSLDVNDTTHHFDHVVVALPPWALQQLALPGDANFSDLTQAFGSQPIATVYLGFDTSFRLPAPLLQIKGPTPDDARVWAMDRSHCGEPGVVAIAISAQGPWCQLSGEALGAASLRAFTKSLGRCPPCRWQKAVIVHRATYAATPQARLPPSHLEPLPKLYLAGDWTHPTYPATLEAAVDSGFLAADRIIKATS